MATAVGLLENGDQARSGHRARGQGGQEGAHHRRAAVVKKVVFVDPTHANVTYDLVGTPLKGATGNAVLVDGKWKVAQTTFCTLVDLGAGTINEDPPAGC